MRGSVRIKLLTGLLSICLIFVTACSSNSSVGKTSAADKPSASPQAQGKIDPLGKYDTPIEITTVRALDPNVKF